MDNNMIKLTGLWINKSGGGETYMGGNLGASRLLMFKNSYKKPDNKEPDYILYIAPAAKQENSKPQAQADNDIPF